MLNMTAQLFMFPDKQEHGAVEEALTFDLWWSAYPHKVCKGQARRAWIAALRKATFQQLMDGVQRYIHDKPDDIPWCNPATFLNGERWADEPATRCRTMSDSDAAVSHMLRNRADMIAKGRNVASVTRQQLLTMVERGWLTKEQACKAGLT